MAYTISSKTVVFKSHFYEVNDKKRAYYSSSTGGGDYMRYIATGINETKEFDYLNYVGDNDKSFGVFNQNGYLTKEEIEEIRSKLRKTKSLIWDCLISLQEGYDKEHLRTGNDAIELMKDVFPKFLKNAGFRLENTTWFAGLHENTDNRHIHICIFEHEPIFYTKGSKDTHFRKGVFRKNTMNELKLNIINHFESDIHKYNLARYKALERAKLHLAGKNIQDFEKALFYHYRQLFEQIPKEGSISYQSKNMDSVRVVLDQVVELFMNHPYHKSLFKEINDILTNEDIRVRKLCNEFGLNPAQYLVKEKYHIDLKRRLGNIIIKDAVNKRNKAYEQYSHIKDINERRKKEIGVSKDLDKILHYQKIASRLEDEENRLFMEYLQRMKEAEIDRLIEEGIISKEEMEAY